ncbi:MAG TPA: polysaccharide biosynthesis tyrosine autokinase [Opitutaceae bacterium]|jgi:succinoglycan biosynthesis transport protein ExoP|nr:polysaccharide biosynthesis tyrosine autokinase [Opitutaceae bacterium]
MNAPSRPPGYNGALPSDIHEYEETEDNNNLRTYWLMIRECKWYALAIFLAIVLVTAIYTFGIQRHLFQGDVTVQVLRRGPEVLPGADVVESTILSDEDLNTQVNILQSVSLVQSVISRLSSDEVQQLTSAYNGGIFGGNHSPVEIIFKNRKIIPQRLSLTVDIQFRHPDPKLAAKVANLFAEEYISYNSRLRVEESMKAVDELKDRADQQRKRVDEIANSLQEYRQHGNLISLEQNKDIVTDKLKALNAMATDTNARLKEAEIRWTQVQDWKKAGKDLTELEFIASQPQVNQLVQQITNQKIALSQLRERYRDKHPSLIQAVNTLTQTQHDLNAAIETAAASIQANYENARKNDEEAHKSLSDQEAKSMDLDKSAVEYDNLDREFRVNEQLLEAMLARMRQTAVTSTIETQSARIIDRAFESQNPVTPNVPINLAVGLLGGIVFGLGFAYFIAVIDDRVKSAFDVESFVGLPVVGVIPRIERMEQPDKAQIVSNGADPMTVEAFLSLHSTLRLKDESKNARFLLLTSTMPGEGKSFITTNLALAFASQGQRTVIVDCDLRKPNVQKSFRLQAGKGVITYCVHAAPLEEIIVRNVHPNLDVITTGGRVKNPAQLLNSKEFETLVTELGKRYDRVLFDTPPLGAVSDAMNILPLMDGAIFAIQFNRVRRRAAQQIAHRLLSANIPVFGAVLNDMKVGLAGEYGEYHDKSYKEYYALALDEGAATTQS